MIPPPASNSDTRSIAAMWHVWAKIAVAFVRLILSPERLRQPGAIQEIEAAEVWITASAVHVVRELNDRRAHVPPNMPEQAAALNGLESAARALLALAFLLQVMKQRLLLGTVKTAASPNAHRARPLMIAPAMGRIYLNSS